MFKKDYEIRVAPNNIPKSIVTPKKIAQEIEEKILNYLVPGLKGYPLEDIVTEHHLGNKKAVKRLKGHLYYIGKDGSLNIEKMGYKRKVTKKALRDAQIYYCENAESSDNQD